MKLTNLKLTNFRRFQKMEINFHPELTVIVAKNGQGKSSVLDAATTALGTFVGAFDLGKAKHIEVKDARYHRLESRAENEQIFPVVVEATISNMSASVIRELTGSKNKTTVKGASELTNYGKTLMQAVRDLQDINLPLMAYYSSGRLWSSHKNIARKAVLSESRTMGYEDCFTSASSFTQVQQWMSKATYAEIQQSNTSGYESYALSDQINGINLTVDKVIANEGWSNFHYSLQHEELAMSHSEFGVMPVSMLSDGVRAMVSMVADMAWRSAKLNPHLGGYAQQAIEGIVFIDEVDMHLHPSWQQTVIRSLQEAFPKIQFIVTTHSPQVLSTVSKDCIRVMGKNSDGDDIAAIPLAASYGEPSNDVLQAIMHVDPQPPVPEKHLLDELTSLVDQGEYQSNRATKLLAELKHKLDSQHPQILKIERSIRRQEAFKA